MGPFTPYTYEEAEAALAGQSQELVPVSGSRFLATVEALEGYTADANGYLNVLCGVAFETGRREERALAPFLCTGCRAEHRIEAMVEHIQTCPEHSMFKLRQERDEALKLLEESNRYIDEAVRKRSDSYDKKKAQYGGSSPEAILASAGLHGLINGTRSAYDSVWRFLRKVGPGG